MKESLSPNRLRLSFFMPVLVEREGIEPSTPSCQGWSRNHPSPPKHWRAFYTKLR